MDVSIDLLNQTAAYVKAYFDARSPAIPESRNFNATHNLVQYCSLIGANSKLKKEDLLKTFLSAWFQYTGICIDPANYRKASADLAFQYLTDMGLSPDTIREIKENIQSTAPPVQPVTLSAQVLCDAESAWMAENSVLEQLEILKEEWIYMEKKIFTETEWLAENIKIFKEHIYFMPFSREMFTKKKEKNGRRLEEKLAELEGYVNSSQEITDPENYRKKPDMVLNKNAKLERGVETLLRNTSRNQIHLIRLADYKASLVISINSIIISVVLSLLIVKLEANTYLELPTLILILTNVTTILTAISATRPNMRFVNKNREHEKIAKTNLLYYENYGSISFDQFSREMQETFVGHETLYNAITRDIYHQGIMLGRKNNRINLSYTIFVAGFLLSILAFIISFLVHRRI
jgi:hypothetical protein